MLIRNAKHQLNMLQQHQRRGFGYINGILMTVTPCTNANDFEIYLAWNPKSQGAIAETLCQQLKELIEKNRQEMDKYDGSCFVILRKDIIASELLATDAMKIVYTEKPFS